MPQDKTPYNPYQAPNSNLMDDYEEDVHYEYAGFWVRFFASIIDSLFFALLIGVPLALMAVFMGMGGWDSEEFHFLDLFSYVISLVVSLFCWVKYAATPGKHILKLKVLDADTGEHLTVGRAFLRYIGYFVSALVFLLGYFWVIWDGRKQGWHDKMANSVVVKRV